MNYENLQWLNKRSYKHHVHQKGRQFLKDGQENCYRSSPRRISVDNFEIPKFRMRLAANHRNPQQLAAFMAEKRATTSSYSRSEFERCSSVPTEQTIGDSTLKARLRSMAFNQCDTKIYMQDVQDSSLLRRRRQNKETGDPKNEVDSLKGGREDRKAVETSIAFNQCTIQDNQCGIEIYLQGVEQSSLLRRRGQTQKRAGPKTDMDSLQTRFQDKIVIYSLLMSPRDQFEMVPSLEERNVIHSPFPLPRDRFEMISSLEEKFVLHSPRTSPRDRFEMVSSLEERIVIHSPLPTPRDRFQMVSSLEEKIVIHSPFTLPRDRFEMVSSLEERIVIHSPFTPPRDPFEIVPSHEEKSVLRSPRTSARDHIEMVSSLEEKIAIQSPLISPRSIHFARST